MSNKKTAILTGGASGIGSAVAESLARSGHWKVHIFDINPKSDADLISGIVYHEVDVTSWESLSAAFDEVFREEVRLDFVFANAGIMEKGGFYDVHDTSSPPPPLDELSIDTNLKGVVRTTYLAQHYFRVNPDRGAKDCVVVMTCSIAGIYPQEFTPLYATAKAGILNFMRSVAVNMYANDGIRTYAICPGSVRTNLLPKQLWDAYPQGYLTSMEKVTSTVEMLLRGGKMQDSNGKIVEEGSNTGLAVEIFVDDIYFRDHPEPCNDGMRYVQSFMSDTKKE